MPRVIVAPAYALPMEERRFEMCEHKGIGHPDTITDGVCEAASRELSHAYLARCGRILHHNLDKGLLLAGRSAPRFGGGSINEPMRFLICGRATQLPDGGNVAGIVIEAARRHLLASIGHAAAPGEIVTEIGETSGNLMRLFANDVTMPRANDTSFGTGYAPYSPLERTVLNLAQMLRSDAFRARFPAAGADFKIMGSRFGKAMTFTIALAFIDRHVDSVAHYFETKRNMQDYLTDILNISACVQLNQLDDPLAKNEDGIYLTVSGLSGEMGDDGQVGRGNRVNGLITPGRAMSLEAAAGKNPVSHVGKLYNVMAARIAQDIHEQVDGACDVSVQLLSAIGAPIDRPQLVGIEITPRTRFDSRMQAKATDIAQAWLADIPKLTNMILNQRAALY